MVLLHWVKKIERNSMQVLASRPKHPGKRQQKTREYDIIRSTFHAIISKYCIASYRVVTYSSIPNRMINDESKIYVLTYLRTCEPFGANWSNQSIWTLEKHM